MDKTNPSIITHQKHFPNINFVYLFRRKGDANELRGVIPLWDLSLKKKKKKNHSNSSWCLSLNPGSSSLLDLPVNTFAHPGNNLLTQHTFHLETKQSLTSAGERNPLRDCATHEWCMLQVMSYKQETKVSMIVCKIVCGCKSKWFWVR